MVEKVEMSDTDTDKADDHYARTHELLDAARTAMASIPPADPIRKVVGLLIEAVEASTFGWGNAELTYEEAGPGAPILDATPIPVFPTLRALMIQGKNCVSVLNEHAQKHGIDMPEYRYEGVGPFVATCHFMGESAECGEPQQTKNGAKHDAAERMLEKLRDDEERRT